MKRILLTKIPNDPNPRSGYLLCGWLASIITVNSFMRELSRTFFLNIVIVCCFVFCAIRLYFSWIREQNRRRRLRRRRPSRYNNSRQQSRRRRRPGPPFRLQFNSPALSHMSMFSSEETREGRKNSIDGITETS